VARRPNTPRAVAASTQHGRVFRVGHADEVEEHGEGRRDGLSVASRDNVGRRWRAGMEVPDWVAQLLLRVLGRKLLEGGQVIVDMAGMTSK
jgi:hypothetical protein